MIDGVAAENAAVSGDIAFKIVGTWYSNQDLSSFSYPITPSSVERETANIVLSVIPYTGPPPCTLTCV